MESKLSDADAELAALARLVDHGAAAGWVEPKDIIPSFGLDAELLDALRCDARNSSSALSAGLDACELPKHGRALLAVALLAECELDIALQRESEQSVEHAYRVRLPEHVLNAPVRAPSRPHTVLQCAKSGLCNRLRTVLSHALAAAETDCLLTVAWAPSDECPGWFLDLFEPPPGVRFVAAPADVLAAPAGEDEPPADEVVEANDYHESCKGLPARETLCWHLLRPTASIAARVEDNVRRCGGTGGFLALHVRRTDHFAIAMRRHVTDDEFAAFCDAPSEHAALPVFLATDCAETQRSLGARLRRAPPTPAALDFGIDAAADGAATDAAQGGMATDVDTDVDTDGAAALAATRCVCGEHRIAAGTPPGPGYTPPPRLPPVTIGCHVATEAPSPFAPLRDPHPFAAPRARRHAAPDGPERVGGRPAHVQPRQGLQREPLLVRPRRCFASPRLAVLGLCCLSLTSRLPWLRLPCVAAASRVLCVAARRSFSDAISRLRTLHGHAHSRDEHEHRDPPRDTPYWRESILKLARDNRKAGDPTVVRLLAASGVADALALVGTGSVPG